MQRLRQQNKSISYKNRRLTVKLENIIQIVLDDNTNTDMGKIMEEEGRQIADLFPEDSYFGNSKKQLSIKGPNVRTEFDGIL